MKLRELRWELWCTAPAINSLPVPVSPRTSTVVLLLATFFTTPSTADSAPLDPMMLSNS